MYKVLLHQLPVLKEEAKLQFQIRLPKGFEKVAAVKVSCTIGTTDQLAGSLWLRIPEKRDVFYSELIHTNSDKPLSWYWTDRKIFSLQPEWWLSGTQQEFFRVDIPVENTIIEGFYRDEHQQDFTPYQVNIYLQLKGKF